MKFRGQRVGILGLAIASSLLTVSCSGGKVAECANVIKVVNQTVIDTKAITDSGTKHDLSTIEKSAEIFDKAAKDLESVNVSDEKLNTYKGQFLSMYKGVTEINKQIIASIKEKKSTKVHQGLNKYTSIVSPERDLATGITQYCQAPPEK